MQRAALVPVFLSAIAAVLAGAVSGHAAATPTSLRGAVGPGFTISLTTARGTLVKRLRAGSYQCDPHRAFMHGSFSVS
jgi:hypothetical protein